MMADSPQSRPTPYPRTLRMSNLPASIDEDRFRKYLTDLECQPGVKSKIKGFSLEPYKDWRVATVSFVDEPVVFWECRAGHQMVAQLPEELSGGTFFIDCDFQNMTILYHPPSNIEYDLIAVSGLSSHAFGSWKSPLEPHVMWLRDCLKFDFPNCRVFVWGYQSDLLEPSATQSIRSYARRLLTDIQVIRGEHEECRRPIIFVGHSLGGLVIKQALVEADHPKCNQHDQNTLKSCVGLFLFGVPNKGLGGSNLLLMVKGKQNAPFVANLMNGSEFLDLLHTWFMNTYENFLKNSCYVVSFYETKDTPTVEKATDGKLRRSPNKLIRMVTKESAIGCTSFVQDCNQIAFDLDHSKLVKFTSRGDNNYMTFWSKMKELVEKPPRQLLCPDTPSAGELHSAGVQLSHNVLNNCLQNVSKRHRLQGRQETKLKILSMLNGIERSLQVANFHGATQQSTGISKSRAHPTSSIIDATTKWISKVQSTSKTLYEALSACTPCACHELYMSLETVPRNNVQLPAHFSVLITDKIARAPTGCHVRLDIVEKLSQVATTCETHISPEPVRLCATEIYDNVTVDATDNFLDGFFVSHNGSDNTTDIGVRKSLKERLNEESKKLSVAERLDLGRRLGIAALHFHSSPWIKSWTMETVTVFDTSGNQQTDSLAPHILSKLTAETRKAPISDLYLLGLMLLQIEGYDPKEIHKTEEVGGDRVPHLDWDLVNSLSVNVGIPYKDFVSGFLHIGLSARGDPVGDKDMEVLFGMAQDLRDYISTTFYGGSYF